MKKILVPTDFSACADKALLYAMNVSKKSGGEIILLHVCELFEINGSKNKDLLQQHNKMVTSDLNRRLEKYRKTGAEEGVQITSILYSGQVVSRIINVAIEVSADMVVMGSQGSTCLKTLIMGANASKVLATCPLPVIAVPSGYEWTEPKKILFATDENETMSDLPVRALAKLYGSNVVSLPFLANGETTVTTKMTSRSNASRLDSIETSSPQKNLDDVLEEYVTGEQIDLLVMFRQDAGMVNGKNKKRMRFHCEVPVMSICS